MPLLTAPTVALVSNWRISKMPFARSASSPAAKFRKNGTGSERSRLQTADWRSSPTRPSMRKSASAWMIWNIVAPIVPRKSAPRLATHIGTSTRGMISARS